MKLRVLIVDDEPLARELIATVLTQEPDVEIVGQCGNGHEAVEAIQTSVPDVVFLDIQMPILDGFGVLAALKTERWPLVIFVTAYDRYAVRAFEVHALDYLLKPFEYERVHAALERARAALRQRTNGDYQRRLVEFLENLPGQMPGWDRLAVGDRTRTFFLKFDEIDWIEAEGNYVRLHAGKKSHLLRETMNSAESRLTAKKFLRIGRSVLVNLERIKEWQPLFHGDSVVILEDGTRLTVSRVYREKLDQLAAQLG